MNRRKLNTSRKQQLYFSQCLKRIYGGKRKKYDNWKGKSEALRTASHLWAAI
jgi:hypothetical protein